MMCLRSVSLVALASLVGVMAHMSLRSQNSTQPTPAMQRGVSVQMASASNARPWPRADDNDAWIVTVDGVGRLYFATDPVTPEGLKQWMIRHPRRRNQKLYIKADARASYASVEKALDAASAAEFAAPVLLLNQRDALGTPGTVVPPKGIEVLIDGVNRGAQSIVVELNGSSSEPTAPTINGEPVSWDSLQSRLAEFVQGSSEKSVFVEADGRATFAEVARVIDACGAVRATPVLSAPTL